MAEIDTNSVESVTSRSAAVIRSLSRESQRLKSARRAALERRGFQTLFWVVPNGFSLFSPLVPVPYPKGIWHLATGGAKWAFWHF